MEKKKKKKKKNKRKKTLPSNIPNNLDHESSFSLFEVIIIILISVIFGVIIGYFLTYGNSNLSRVRSNTYLGEIVSTYNNIVDNYYESLDEKELSESAIKGMISSLDDPYSVFLDEGTTDSFNESVDGEYVGIGVTIAFQDEYDTILSIMNNSPAKDAGLQVGDVILSIDGVDCHNKYPEELNSLLSGKAGTSLNMEVLRGEEHLSFVLKRDIIEIQNVTSRMILEEDRHIGYIKISIFSSNSYDQFIKQLNKLEKKKMDSLIIDVRDNPGGHLLQARKILSIFFPKKTVLYQIESNGIKKKVYSMNNDVKKYPVVILVNGETASSAEVLASCFQENYLSIHLVGSTTYGKGNVQKSVELSNGSSIKFTIESWLTSKGVQVNEVGITPDIYEEQNPVYYVEYLEEDDTQLLKAISLLK